MTFNEAIQQVESYQFAARLGLASSRAMFTQILHSEPAYMVLREAIRREQKLAGAVIKRLKALCEVETDPEFQNPYDIALATLCWLLFDAGPKFSFHAIIATELIGSSRDTWWAAHAANAVHQRFAMATKEQIGATSAQFGPLGEHIRVREQANTVARAHMRFAVRLNTFDPDVVRAVQRKSSNVEQVRRASNWSSYSFDVQSGASETAAMMVA